MIAFEAEDLRIMFEEEAKQAQGTRNDLKKESNITQNFGESCEELDPETAATIAVEMGDKVKPRHDRETTGRLAKTMGTNRGYVRKTMRWSYCPNWEQLELDLNCPPGDRQ
jgi:hypothetical protein